MQAVVLMGGLGTRLGEQTKKHPKSMLRVEGLPFFDYELFLLKRAGFTDFLFLTGFGSEEVEEYYGDGSSLGVKIDYSKDGEKLLGTGGAVRRAFDKLEEEFLLLYGDSFMDIDYGETLERYSEAKKDGATCLMTVMKNAGRFDKSNCVVREGKLLSYDKENPLPEMDYIDYGVSVYKKSLFAGIPEGEAFDIARLQKAEAAAGRCGIHIVNRRFYEIGRPESLSECAEYIKHRFYEAHPAVFLDRDGVINHIVYNEDTELLDSPLSSAEFSFLPGVKEALRTIKEKGFYIFVVTNQPAAAKGKTKLLTLMDINTAFVSELAEEGIELEAVYACYHHPTGSSGNSVRGLPPGDKRLVRECGCRKSKPGLLLKGKESYNLDWEKSVMVGDSATDIEAGRAAGLKTALIGELKCDVCARLNCVKPDGIYKNLVEFANAL